MFPRNSVFLSGEGTELTNALAFSQTAAFACSSENWTEFVAVRNNLEILPCLQLKCVFGFSYFLSS